jgi:hypothetical protein
MEGHTFQEIADILNSWPAAIGASAGRAGGSIHLWDLATGASQAKVLAAEASFVTALAVGGLGKHRAVVSGDRRGAVQLWNVDRDTRKKLLVKRDRAEISAVALGHVAGRAVVVSASTWSKLVLWDADSGQQVHEGVDVSGAGTGSGAGSGAGTGTGRAGRRVAAVAVGGTDDSWLAVTVNGDGHQVQVWDLRTGQRRWSHYRRPSRVTAVAVGTAGGRLVAVGGCADGAVVLWDLATGEPGRTLARHQAGVTAVAAGNVHGNAVVLSACSDGLVRMWDIGNGQERQVLPTGHRDEVVALAMYTIDNPLTAGAVEGRLRRLRRRFAASED